jgi:hypothetical protein
MGKESGNKRNESASNRSQDEAIADALEGRNAPVWIREDGAICVGNECIVIKPREGSKRDLDIEIKPDMCGAALADKFADTLYKTIGRGGSTNFKIKSQLETEETKER